MLYLAGIQYSLGSESTGIVEYWIDSDYNTRTIENIDGNDVSISLPLNDIVAGVHFFNVRAIRSDGNHGNLTRTMFYIPENMRPDIAGYEYWIDDNRDRSTCVECRDLTTSLIIDISEIEPGDHILNIRAKNSVGHWGDTVTEAFSIPMTSGTDNIEYTTRKNIYDLKGHLIMQQVSDEEINLLPKGIYIVNGRTIMVR